MFRARSLLVAFAVVVGPAAVLTPEPAAAGQLPTITAHAPDARAAEGNSSDRGVLSISRIGKTGEPLDVHYTVFYSTAARVADYVPLGEGTPNGGTSITQTATIPAGKASVELPIVTKQDDIAESDETVLLSLFPKPRAYTIGKPADATVEIVDDEAAVRPSAPSDLVATSVSRKKVNLAWTDVPKNENGFRIETRPEGTEEYEPLVTVPALTNAFSVLSPPPGEAVTYRVIAFNDQGDSPVSNEASAIAQAPEPRPWQQNVTVAGEKGRFKGWPTNGGMWNWGDEMVVLYEDDDFRPAPGTIHNFAFHKPSHIEQARSLDGGETWTVEKEPIVKPGAPGFPTDGLYGPGFKELTEPVDFENPDFAMHVQMTSKDYGPSYWYYSYDRARTWRGPFRLPNFGLATVNARTDYVVDGNNEMLLFLSGTPDSNDEGRSRPFAVRTTDGGMTWKFLSNVDEEGTIQPSTVRVSSTELVSATRTRTGVRIHASGDNGASWSSRSIVTAGANASVNSPGSLVLLPDGRLVLVYGYRSAPFGIRTRISTDDGRTWSDEVVLRKDGGTFDLGYTRAVLRPDGKVVTTYYLNTNPLRERTVQATIFDPDAAFATTDG